MSYKIQSNIPIPTDNGKNSRKSELRKVMEKMEIGQSIAVEGDRQTFHSAVSSTASRINIKATTRKIVDNGTDSNTYRIWRTK